MSNERFQQGSSDVFSVTFLQGIDGNTGADGKIFIYDEVAAQWWNGAAFVAGAPIELSMNKVSDVNAPGLWEYPFTYPNSDTRISARMIDKNLSSNSNVYEAQAYVGYYVENIDAKLSDIEAAIGSLSVGAGGISTITDTFVLTLGSVASGTVSDTQQLDGVSHEVDDAAGNTDFYYEFDVGVSGVATEIRWNGYVQLNNDVVNVFGYDWISASWKQISTLEGANGTTIVEKTFVVTRDMTGTAGDSGKVRIRFESTNADKVATDRILCEYTALLEAGLILHTGIAQAGGVNTITLDAGANANDDFYNHARVVISSGTGLEQERVIVDYDGATKVAKIAPPWITQPDNTSAFEVVPATVHAETGWATIKVGLAAAATANTITFDSDASAVDDYYNDNRVHIDSGTGDGQTRIIVDYDGATRTATLNRAWATTPDTTSEYIIEEAVVATEVIESSAEAQLVDAVWDEIIDNANHNIAKSAGKRLRQAGTSLAVEGSVDDATPTTTSFVTDLTETNTSFYADQTCVFVSGALEGQARVITNYDGGTKVLTFDEPWTVAPADTDEFEIKADHVHPVSQMAAAVWDEDKTGHVAADSFGEEVQSHSTSSEVATVEGKVDIVDTNVDAIVAKLPTNFIMGSSTQADMDGVINDIKTAVDEINNETDPAAIAAAVWDSLKTAHTAPGSFGLTLQDVETIVTAIKASTDPLPADPASESNATANTTSINNNIDANEAKIDIIDSNVDGIVAKMPTNFVMGSSTQADKDGVIDDIKTAVDEINTETDPAAIAAAVWDSLLANHTDAGSFGLAIATIEAAVTASNLDLQIIKGLGHENMVNEPSSWAPNGAAVAGKIYLYDSKANADLNDKVTGLLAEYSYTAPRSGDGLRMLSFKQVLEP